MTQLEFTFLTVFLMLQSFSWPAPHVSCLAVYSWWAWVLLWQCFLRSSAWPRARLDYSNLPCYRLLLLFLTVPAVKGTLWLSVAHFSVFVSLRRWQQQVCRFLGSLGWTNGHCAEPRHHGIGRCAVCLFFCAMCAPAWISRSFIRPCFWFAFTILAFCTLRHPERITVQTGSAITIKANHTKLDPVKTDTPYMWWQSNHYRDHRAIKCSRESSWWFRLKSFSVD